MHFIGFGFLHHLGLYLVIWEKQYFFPKTGFMPRFPPKNLKEMKLHQKSKHWVCRSTTFFLIKTQEFLKVKCDILGKETVSLRIGDWYNG